MDLISWAGRQTQTPMAEMTDKICFSLCKTQTFNHTLCNSQLKHIFFFPLHSYLSCFGDYLSPFCVWCGDPKQASLWAGGEFCGFKFFTDLPFISSIRDKQKWYPPTNYQNKMCEGLSFMIILEEFSGSSRIKIKELSHRSCLFQLSISSIISMFCICGLTPIKHLL